MRPKPDGRARLLLAVGALAALLALGGCVVHPPRPVVCVSCEHGVEAATDDVSVGHSELLIAVHEDGDSTWTVRAEVSGAGVDALRADAERVDRLAERAVVGSVGGRSPYVAVHGGDVADRSGRLEGDTLVLTFEVADVAHRGPGGVLVFDRFNTAGRAPPARRPGADRVAVRGPPGTVVANGPPGAEVPADRRTAVWSGASASVDGHAYVVFGPDDGGSTWLAARVALAADVAGWLVPRAVATGGPYAAVLVVVGLVLVRHATGDWLLRVGEDDPWGPVDPPVLLLGAVATPLAVAGLLVYGVGKGVSAPGVGLVVALVAAALLPVLRFALDHSERAARALVAVVAGSPLVVASHRVAVLPTRVTATESGWAPLVSTAVVLVVGVPLFYLVGAVPAAEEPSEGRPVDGEGSARNEDGRTAAVDEESDAREW